MTASRYAVLLAASACSVVLSAAEPAAAVNAAETRLRDALRTAMLQLRDEQGKTAEVRAALDAKTDEAAALKKKADALAKQGAADRDTAAKKIAGLDDKSAKLEAELAKAKDLAGKWKEAAEKNAGIARAVDAERAKFETLSQRLTVRVADREAHNVKLVGVSREILNRFEKYALGEAIAGREPFIGVKRVEIQNIVQDYGDKIAGQKVKPGSPAPGETTTK